MVHSTSQPASQDAFANRPAIYLIACSQNTEVIVIVDGAW